ncbi:Fe-S cluster biosynthesis and repair protein YggX [Neisseria sp. HSC-16F19]|nr:oxidative damage protection protein [Neisseria sp. HSC-16F19]MCP2040094.1 Fe-S cluster biosynthesis and repair protein YggX [Neisseria sp. HSC-16F19]
MTRMVHCIKLGKEAPGMKFPPLPGELGKRVFDNVSQEAWDGWIRHQTMLINENRLSLADVRARQYLSQQMENYFFGDGADQVQGYTPPQG